MNLKEYLEIRNKNLTNKSALSSRESRILGIRLTKGWQKEYADLLIDDRKFMKLTSEVIKSNAYDARCRNSLLSYVRQSQDYDDQLLYLMKSESGLYKIGISSNPVARQGALEGASGHKIEIVQLWNTKLKARDVEKHLHQALNEYRIRGEWFNLGDKALRIIDNLLDEGFVSRI